MEKNQENNDIRINSGLNLSSDIKVAIEELSNMSNEQVDTLISKSNPNPYTNFNPFANLSNEELEKSFELTDSDFDDEKYIGKAYDFARKLDAKLAIELSSDINDIENIVPNFDKSKNYKPHTILTGMGAERILDETYKNNLAFLVSRNGLINNEDSIIESQTKNGLQFANRYTEKSHMLRDYILDKNPNAKEMRIVDIGSSFNKNNMPSHLSAEDIDEIEKIMRNVRGFKSPFTTFASPFGLIEDEHINTQSKNDFVLPDLSQSIIKTFNNELLIYNNETLSPQNNQLGFIDRFKEVHTEFIDKIKENHQLVKNNIFELLNKNYDINIIYVEKGVGVITHIVDFYNNKCHIEYLRNDDIENLDTTTFHDKVICLDCTAVKEPHLILKNKFENKKLILIVDIHHFSLINKITNFEHRNIVNSKINLSVLPSEEEFKKRAWELKEEKGIKLTAALNELSNLYGYSCFNAIKPKLINSK